MVQKWSQISMTRCIFKPSLSEANQAPLLMGLISGKVGSRAPRISGKVLTTFSEGLLSLCQASLSPPDPPRGPQRGSLTTLTAARGSANPNPSPTHRSEGKHPGGDGNEQRQELNEPTRAAIQLTTQRQDLKIF